MDARGRLFRMSVKRKTYGDAHFETPDEYDTVAIVQKPADAYGTILGQIDDSGKHVINYRMDSKNRANQHIAIVGSSGSGKTFTFSKPYCYQVTKRRESIILTDPDGGLYRDMAGYFEDKGYVVRRFDLKNLRKSDGWECSAPSIMMRVRMWSCSPSWWLKSSSRTWWKTPAASTPPAPCPC